jgi:NAD(P)-dependent dehydrogenase (short-subunit alcohol dehydrogenase family)
MTNPHRPDAETSSPGTPHRRAYETGAATARASGARPVALVTGAARRIGRVIALELAHAGFDIALHHRGTDSQSHMDAQATAGELRAAGVRVELFDADFSDVSATSALLPAVAESFGRVDAVVNSASRFEYDSPTQFSPELLESLIRSNTAAPIMLAQALAAQVATQAALPDGLRSTPCVVNVLDQKLSNPNPDYLSYTLTKAALQHATVLLAQALAPAVRVCGVSPGITLVSGPMDDEQFAKAHRLTALGHSSTPEDIARAVRFLLESPAITGIDLLVDGGQHLVGQPRDVLFLTRDATAASDFSTPAAAR